jgi:hydroxyacylglutathione hydrolase
MILEGLALGPYQSNCYLVGSEKTKRCIVIDPGDEGEEILNAVREAGLTVAMIVLTHAHIDHVSALSTVKKETGAPFSIHESEKAIFSSVLKRIQPPLSPESAEALSQPDRLLKDGDSIDVDDLHFTVIHTPGHTPGGICLMGHGIVFTGDTLFYYGIGRTDFPGGSTATLMKSLRDRLMTLPDETIVYPGHGPATAIGKERRGNPFLV